jgi:hypothetical protein
MGCNCKKKGEELRVTNVSIIEEINPLPQTPDELLSQELNKWNGGPQITNNNGEDIKTTSTEGTSE